MAQTIWRYMTFEGFCSLIVRRALWFSRIDLFPDKTEGRFPAKYYNVEFLEDQYKKALPDYEWKEGFGPRWQAEQAVTIHRMETLHRRRWAVNSWHASRIEAEALWKTYASLGKGIGVQSTFERLKTCFRDEGHSVTVDRVKYVDRDRFFPDFQLPTKPFLLKPRSYSYEKEIRAYIDLLEGVERPPMVEFNIEDATHSDDIKIPQNSELRVIEELKGVYVEVDLDTLILRVVVGPSCDPWIQGLVDDLLSNRGIKCPCMRSTLYDYPELR